MPLPIATDRLRLSVLGADDVVAFVAYRRDPEVARYQSWDADYPLDDGLALVRGQAGSSFPPLADEWLQLAVRDVDSGQLAGDVAVHTLADQPDTYELGVTFASVAQGRGFATEAVGAVLAELFEHHGAHRVIAHADARNDRVRALLTRAGMRHEGRAVDADFFKGEWTTLDTFALLAGEFGG